MNHFFIFLLLLKKKPLTFVKFCKSFSKNIKVFQKNADKYIDKGTKKVTKMGLAIAQIQFLTLTTRKADCEFGITMDSMQKTALTREMSLLTNEYNSKLQSKNLVYYANGGYNPINYEYLMGGEQIYLEKGNPLKDHNSMILTDYKGKVVLNDTYSRAITTVLGTGCMDHLGRGKTFSPDLIPEMLAQFIHGVSVEEIKNIIDGKKLEDSTQVFNSKNSMTGESSGRTALVDINNTGNLNHLLIFIIRFLLQLQTMVGQ